jgi:hypothetical protein
MVEHSFCEQLEVLRFEIHSLITFEQKLKKWAEFTVNYCDKVARTKIDRSFYAFQSKPRFNPEVLLLGLNPHENNPYTSQLSNAKWGLVNGMTPEVFIQQNPWYTGGKQAADNKDWPIIKRYKKIISVHTDLSQQLDNMVYMNILYFNSIDFKEFKTSFPNDWKEVFDNCIQLTRLAIFDIIKPKKIVCFGKGNCFNSFTDKTTPKITIGPIIKGKVNETVVYGFTHPSARISDVERLNIGMHLYADWFNKPVSDFMAAKLTKIKKILSEIAVKQKLELEFDSINLKQRFGKFYFYKPGGNNYSICFEFQRAYFSDLRFELHNGKFKNVAKKCKTPFANWLTLEDEFEHEDFKEYFHHEISSLVKNLYF